jgi:hypothetical protein
MKDFENISMIDGKWNEKKYGRGKEIGRCKRERCRIRGTCPLRVARAEMAAVLKY